jgi:hypothetical protein
MRMVTALRSAIYPAVLLFRAHVRLALFFSCLEGYIPSSYVDGDIMAILTRSNAVSALAEGQPVFRTGAGRFTIGITGHDGIPITFTSPRPKSSNSLILWTTNMTRRPSY